MIFDSRIQKEATALRDKGHEVTILYVEDQQFFYGLPDPEEAWNKYLHAMEGIRNIRVFLKSRMWRFLPSKINKSIQALELFFKFSYYVWKNKVDVYHSHDLTPGIFGVLGKIYHRAKHVYDAHELEVEVSKSSTWTKNIKRKYERFVMKHSSAAITVNQYIADVMSSNYNKRVHVIANLPEYVSLEELKPEVLPSLVNKSNQKNIVLYVGNVSLTRGIDKVAEAMKYLPEEYVFLIMGTGRVAEFKKILSEIQVKNNIAKDRISFVGPFPPNEVVKILSGATVSVMLYQANTDNSVINAPNKFYQSVMARVPVLASNNKSFPVLIHKNKCGSVGETTDETDPFRIAETIRDIVEHGDYQSYKKSADCLAYESSWNSEVNKLVQIYSEL